MVSEREVIAVGDSIQRGLRMIEAYYAQPWTNIESTQLSQRMFKICIEETHVDLVQFFYFEVFDCDVVKLAELRMKALDLHISKLKEFSKELQKRLTGKHYRQPEIENEIKKFIYEKLKLQDKRGAQE